MDVKYSPEAWQGMKDGLDTLTGGKFGGGAKSSLLKLDDLLEDIESKIDDKDSDGSISFSHTSKKSKIDELFKDYQKLTDYCLKAGGLVEDHIDAPFAKKLDAFADKMEGLSLHNYKTKNRIGSKETTYVGYGMNKTAVQEDKAEITVNDIFKDSAAFDHVLNEEYKAFKDQNPDIELNYEDYSKAIVSARGFEYESVSDVQKNQELWRDLIIGGGVVVLTIFCAPVGLVVAGAYGTAQISSAATGKDWMTGRELNTGERFERGAFGALDILPGAAVATQSFKGVATIGKLSSRTEHVVQSLKDSKTLWSNRMRVSRLKAQDKLNDAGFAIKKQFAKSADALSDIARGTEVQGGTLARKGTDFYGHVNDAHQASKSKIQESIQRIEREIASEKVGGKISSAQTFKGYTGGRTQKELDDLAGDPSHGGRIEEQGIKEREIGLDLEGKGKLGRIVRDPTADKGAEFIDTKTGIKWDVKSFESYPNGHTSPKKGAFTVNKAMNKIEKEFDRGHNVIIDKRKLVPEHIDQLEKAIKDAGFYSRILWYPD
ncbi:hypothetical protein L3137_20785 [Bacillus sonorensis]|uniref:hypothetical protein n=1 Tax=Bacillus sonorensis TaxID=119858 RepID=UPI001F338286|nr:hypothetical protein [Bacillus sonorensis]MCF7619671.1 hypothetical protein [Bacillus sonorensis]